MTEFSLLSKPFLLHHCSYCCYDSCFHPFHGCFMAITAPLVTVVFCLSRFCDFYLFCLGYLFLISPVTFIPVEKWAGFLDKGNVCFFSDEEGEKNPSALWCISQMSSRRDLCSDAVVHLLLVAQNTLFSSSKLKPPGRSCSNQHLNLWQTL